MITLKQFDGATISPADDAALYAHFEARCGAIQGMEITHLGSNQIRVGSGRGIICGRSFVVEEETIAATLSTSGAQRGRLIVQLDIANAEKPISFITQAASTLPDLTQEDLNAGGTMYQFELANFSVNETAISNLVAAEKLSPVSGAQGIMTIKNGGTGASTAKDALANLGAMPSAGGTFSGMVTFNGIVLKKNRDYGTSFPTTDLVEGRLFFKKV